MNATAQPFSQLRRLKGHVTRMAIATLLPCLSKLELLDLNLDLDAPITNTVDLLSSLAGCSNLRDLEIYYRNSCSTRGCDCLERIELHTSTNPYAIEAPGVTDAHIEMLATLLPHLPELKLGMDADLSTQSLLSFSVYCPELREIDSEGVSIYPSMATRTTSSSPISAPST